MALLYFVKTDNITVADLRSVDRHFSSANKLTKRCPTFNALWNSALSASRSKYSSRFQQFLLFKVHCYFSTDLGGCANVKAALTGDSAGSSELPMWRTEVGVDLNDNDNDNDKRLGLTAKADQPDHKKIQYTKNKTDNEAVQKLHSS